MRRKPSFSGLLRWLQLPLVWAVGLAMAGPTASADHDPNRLTEAERRTGWRLLFDGKSLDAFRGFRQDVAGSGWQVVDGAIVRTAKAGDLITKETFDSFELQLEYRIGPGGNSGVMFHVTEEEDKPWKTGPEVQVQDNAAGKDPQQAGWLYQLYQPKPPAWVVRTEQAAGLAPPEFVDATRPAGQWNHLYLRVTPASGEVCLNGVSYFTFVKGSKDWDERVAKSKFAVLPAFGKATRGHLCLQDHGDEVAYRSIKLRALPAGRLASDPVDGMLPVEAVPAFPDIAWEGWRPESEDGKPVPPLRPLVVTHAGDGSGRRFVLDQSGMIHVIDHEAREARLFLDIRDRTRPWKKSNEEGLLGIAFHPRFVDTGEFYLCYSPIEEPQVERVSRFRVSKHDAQRADPSSEEVVLRIEQPFPNHNGGSIAFGTDGHLYVGLGDGGSRNDPLDNAQNLATVLGKILRIDIDRRDSGKAYAIPSDNPFVGRSGAAAEIWAYGFRNPWQLACDPVTGRLWVADVGQDLQEEIDVVVRGGNYGWRRREGTHPFGNDDPPEPVVEPVWEYDHQVGKSITGGCVVRGGRVPEIEGRYLYGDFVSGRLWALAIDAASGADMSGVSNMGIPWNGLPIFGFGLDEEGTAYVTTASQSGQGVFRLVRKVGG
jgi:glucose/arabinose dehydrogenase